MSDYNAPLQDLSFVMNELAGIDELSGLPGYEEATPDLVEAVLEESGRMSSEILAPLNRTGDVQGSRLVNDRVKTPDGWIEAYRTFIEGGWNGLAFSPEFGGQGLPWVVATAVQEMWYAANMSFGLCPLLTQGAVEAIELHGTDDLKQKYLPKMVAGQWSGTMNLTEPQAGSDLSAVRTRAEPQGDHYLIRGQKIYITYGDHDLTENIIHMVLARTPDAPAGVKGISLFIVPKFLLDENGDPSGPNDVRTVSLEHKLGIHASPTCVLSYGDNEGAVGHLVGEENRGLEYMFTMMNLARHTVGVQGVAIAERAYQAAVIYAGERVQGRVVGDKEDERRTIINHPDVRRNLMLMKCQIEAMRALICCAAAQFDRSMHDPDELRKNEAQAMVELLTPVVKGWCTEVGQELTSIGIQIHGGMGFIEETGAAQHYRDSRVTTIYEGTTGIQAADLVGRKLIRDQAATARKFIAEMLEFVDNIDSEDARMVDIRNGLLDGIDALSSATEWLMTCGEEDIRLPLAASSPYLRLWGTVVGGWLMARSASVAELRLEEEQGDLAFYRRKINTCHFYAVQVLPMADMLSDIVRRGSNAVISDDDMWAA